MNSFRRSRTGARTPGRVGGAFTLVEALVTVSVVALLAAMLVPSLARAKEQARLACCAAGLHNVDACLKAYLAGSNNLMPPFAFSDFSGNLPLSGHWGGQSQDADPDCFGRKDLADINLWRLVACRQLRQEQLLCPSADERLSAGQASHFPYTSRFSTYCLRMPYSPDLFRDAAPLENYSGMGTLGAYIARAGGAKINCGQSYEVPLVRFDGQYVETGRDGARRACCLLEGPVVADGFWQRSHSSPGQPGAEGLAVYPVSAGWCHKGRFNVLFGEGAVRAVADDGTVRANSTADGSPAPDDHANYSSYAIAVWRFFQDAK